VPVAIASLIQWSLCCVLGCSRPSPSPACYMAALSDFTSERQAADVNAIIVFLEHLHVVVLLLANGRLRRVAPLPPRRAFRHIETVVLAAGRSPVHRTLADIFRARRADILGPAPGSLEDMIWLRLDHVGEIAARIVYGTGQILLPSSSSMPIASAMPSSVRSSPVDYHSHSAG